jgi:spermidine/putrescine transport system ATP-binding protein
MGVTSTSDVQLRQVTKRFGEVDAVKGISLEVRKGEFVTLLGPSGCGKTTTLRMIGGFEVPDAGEILVDGRPVDGIPATARRTRMVFQNYALFPHLTVRANVTFGLRMHRVPPADARARTDQILEMMGLADKAGAYPRQLSGGQQQRVALARALVTRPTVLLLDEPLGALDLKMRKRMQGELKKLQRDVGITFIYVTHDQEEALALSDVVVVMDQGVIAQSGRPEEVYRTPSTRYVADFIGETNLLEGVVAEVSAGAVAVRLGPDAVVHAVRVVGGAPAVGATVTVAVRPEQVAADVRPAATGNVVPGTVRQRTFLGPSTRLAIELPGGAMLNADQRGVSALGPGEKVYASFQPDDAVVLRT